MPSGPTVLRRKNRASVACLGHVSYEDSAFKQLKYYHEMDTTCAAFCCHTLYNIRAKSICALIYVNVAPHQVWLEYFRALYWTHRLTSTVLCWHYLNIPLSPYIQNYQHTAWWHTDTCIYMWHSQASSSSSTTSITDIKWFLQFSLVSRKCSIRLSELGGTPAIPTDPFQFFL